MFLEIKQLLNAEEVARLMTLARELKFVEGRASNPANVTKDNLQADLADPNYAESVKIVADAFNRSRQFRDFAFPRRIASPLLCRYEPGMKYGPHADAGHIQTDGVTLQSDLSATAFVADPSSYEGGELVVHLGTKAVPFKGSPGSAIIYPSTSVHEVRPVRSGARIVSITFIESLIADEHKRTQLYELNEIAALEGAAMRWESKIRLSAVRENLLRMWSRL